MWIIWALLSAIFAAAVAILGKLGLKNFDSITATALRSAVMTGLLFPAAWWLGRLSDFNWRSISLKDWWLLLAAGAAGALSWLAYFAALKHGPATAVAALDRLSIVFVILLSVWFLGESLSLKTALGGLLILLGAVLLVWR